MPRIAPLLGALLGALLASSPLAGAGTGTALQGVTTLVEETEPSFVLRMAFRVAKPGGTSALLLRGPKGKEAYRIALSDAALSLEEVGPKARRSLGDCAVRYTGTNDLLVIRRKSLLRVALNGEIRLESGDARLPIAQVALADPGRRLSLVGEARCQPTEEIALSDDFMTTPDAPSRWDGVAGTWHVAGVSRPRAASDPFKFIGFAGSEGMAFSSESYWFWNDYRASISARLLGAASGMGLLFGRRETGAVFGFSWGGPKAEGSANRLRLWRRDGKRMTVLAERPAYARVGQWYRLSVETRGARITARVDENDVLTAEDPRLLGGQCGLHVEGREGAEFDDWSVCASDAPETVRPAAEEAEAPVLDREFADDPLMSAWGSVDADWESVSQGGQRWCWHRAVLFDAASVDLNEVKGLPALSEVILMGESGSADVGYRVALGAGKLTLFHGGKPVKEAVASQAPTRVEVGGGRMRVLGAPADGSPACLLEYTDPKPLTRGRVGVRFAGRARLDAVARAVRIASPRMAEYRFDAAPVDWGIEAGEWIATTRWACVPHWNFFGAHGDPMSTLWNKRRFGGDQWIEAFVAPREGTSDRMHFAAPINLNLSFCAAGEETCSGYSLVYRSHDESALLYRRGKLVAENKEIVLPRWRDDQMFVYYRITQTWHHFEVLREGGRIRVWVEVPSNGDGRLERRLLFDYNDPDPLPGDRLGLWTWGDNGMAVARVRVSAARCGGPVAGFLQAPVSGNGAGARARVNPINGGWFRTDLARWVDAGKKPVIAFDYRADPRTALALYAVAGGQRFRADFLGKVTHDGDSVPMGSVRLNRGAGGWTHAEFPLRQALRTFFPAGKLPLVEQLFLASLSTRPDLIGGLAANPRGCAFHLRPAAPAAAPASGLVFRLASAKSDDVPAGDVRIAVADTTLDPAACAVTVCGKALRPGALGLRWDGIRRELVANLTEAGLHFRDRQEVSLSVSAPGREPLSLAWRMRVGGDKTPPTAPVVATSLGPDRVETFERDMGSWRRLGGEQGASLWRDDTTRASGRCSLRLTHRRVAGSFAAALCEKPFDVRRWSLLTFAYRARPEVQLSLVLEIAGKWYEMRFTDRDSTFPVVGAIAGVKADGEWHRAEVDLAAAARASGAGTTVISRLFFADTGWMNNVQDIAWHVDDVRFVPALPIGQAETLTWQASDLSGIAGYSWVLDAAPATEPDTQPEPAPAAAVPAGATYLHVRACDTAGNWGPTTHYRFVPLAAAEHPAPEATPAVTPDGRIPAPAMEVALKNGDTLDVESVRWWVRRGDLLRAYDLAGGRLRWDRAKGVLTWSDPSLATEEPAPILCGVKARDLSGKMVLYREWRWSVDPSLDKTPPAAPYVSCVPQNRLARADFERGIPPEVELRRAAWMFHELGDAALGSGSVRVVNLEADDFFSAFLRKAPYAVHDFPRVSFDYRFETSGCNLNVVSVVNGDMQTIGFAGRNGAYDVFVQNNIGRVEGVKQDGAWHHAEFDFGALLRKRYPKTPRFFADYLGTWATGVRAAYDNPRGASLWLDNITFYSPRATSAAFEWQPPEDANGIRGYSYVLDQKADTVPDETVDTQAARCERKGLEPGKWFFHVRACDGAGNWGPAAHVPFELTR